MSDDLIKRSDAIKAMRDALVAAEIPYAVNALFKVPSADRPQGEWIHSHEGTIADGLYCSNCGKHGYGEKSCPNCEAHMKGADDERL